MRKLLFVSALFVFATLNLFSSGRREKTGDPQAPPTNSIETVDTGSQTNSTQENTMKILGQIQIYGNEPHTFAGIVDQDGTQYSIYPPSVETELRSLQGCLIEFTVIMLNEPQGYGAAFLKGGTVTPLKWEKVQ